MRYLDNMQHAGAGLPERAPDDQILRVTFQPRFEELVDLTMHAAQHCQQMQRSSRRRVSGRRLVFSYFALVACVFALAFSLPTQAHAVLAFIASVGPTLGVLVVLGVAYFVWARLTVRSRYRHYLAPAELGLRRAGDLTITVSRAGVEAVDAMGRRNYSWRACDGVVDTGHSIIIFIGMVYALGAPYRAFDSISAARAFFEFASKHQAAAAAPSEPLPAASEAAGATS